MTELIIKVQQKIICINGQNKENRDKTQSHLQYTVLNKTVLYNYV